MSLNRSKSEIKIAVDGPSGAGKGELCKRLAERLGLLYMDTGSLYRAVGLYVYRSHIRPDDTAGITACLSGITVELHRTDGAQIVLLNGEDVSREIRKNHVSMYASAVSKIPAVRQFLDRFQKDAAEAGGIIMDGRDIGTVIMPDAKLKIYLTASPEVRAVRRCKQLKEAGHEADYDTILKEILERDANDANREVAPAVASSDAVILDNSELTIPETVDCAVRLAEQAFGL